MSSSGIMDNVTKKQFLEAYLAKQKDLGKRQREYKKILLTKLKTCKETIIEASYENAIEQLKLERDNLRAQIWVASGVTHMRENNRCLHEIQCHVQCQEGLANDIRTLKTATANLEAEINRVNKQVYELTRKIVPEAQHQDHVAKQRKKLMILENQLEVGISRECIFATSNGELREELTRIINHRSSFNESYTKLVQKLNSDKKYLIDLVDYALATFDNCIDIYEKIENYVKNDTKERDMRKVEMQVIMRKIAADSDTTEFMDIKGKGRVLADLEPKEYKRREKFRREHTKKINLYTKILEKIQAYTQTKNIEKVIEKFQQQESLYYSYFNYANEISYHLTLLTNTVNSLYRDIDGLKKSNLNALQEQQETIQDLEKTLQDKRHKNTELQKYQNADDQRLASLLQGIEDIFKLCECDARPLMVLLGNHQNVDLVNVRRFLKILERRAFDITASVYIMERNDDNRAFGDYVVKHIEKICEYPTELQDIVLTQQCPECAEGDAYNIDDTVDGGITVYTKEDAMEKLYEKVNQPEMQYRLHSISQCRLPRSRVLAAKRHV